MSPDAPRLAIIGCGAVVEHHLLPALRRAGWIPSVLVDTSQARCEHLKGRLPGKGRGVLTAGEWDSVRDSFDAAIVAAPHVFHGPIGRALVAAGKHAFMEKPLATASADAEAMVEEAERRGLTLSVGLLRRYLDVARWTKALLASGTLGEVERFDAREGFVFNWAVSSDALLRRDLSGGGVLMDTGAHALDLIGWYLGELRPLAYSDDAERGVEADCVLTCASASGAFGRIELSRTRNLRNTLRIDGSRGFVEVHLYKNEVVSGSPAVLAFEHEGLSPSSLRQQLFPALFDAEIRDFRASIETGAAQGVPGREGLAAVALVEAAYRIRTPLALPWAEPRRADAPALPPGSAAVITGATGFVGGRLAERLVEDGIRVRCLVRSISQAARLARLPVEIVRLDLADAPAVARAVEGGDYVFHCAYDPRSRQQNIGGTRAILAACSERAVRRLVHVSSFSVYEPFPDGELSEATPDGNRNWEYIRTKLDLEGEVLAAARSGKVQATVVQPTIVYGPHSKPWTDGPAEMLIYGEVILPDGGTGLCNPVHIDDLVDGMLLAATKPDAVGERFILSGPEIVTWGRFFGTVADALRIPGPSCWPKDRIMARNHGLWRDIRMVASDPRRIVQIVVRWPPARQALQAGLDALPKPARALVDKYYFGGGGKKIGQVHLPDPRTLALYAARPTTDSEKARSQLGYHPVRDFETGMAQTARYLNWAYADVRGEVARRAPPTASRTPFDSPDFVNAV
ncbi:NAD-dependent epimerase/dehydratase family protein [Enterovirga aerilata]|uniref:NAD-dependent epimerase/dehydratase family protein n=1 Tax=Enterovirga aerilata TaxID=2730920 RepID=A0A849I3T2_9HYPH|nr:NAD-dependent epimerase/dehydratase family protein [Enterovirga sp. DB1703]NNM74082.1 NAD-dependent epimerase/dehydratase family protein [Enterovirga sp. DB1703]